MFFPGFCEMLRWNGSFAAMRQNNTARRRSSKNEFPCTKLDSRWKRHYWISIAMKDLSDLSERTWETRIVAKYRGARMKSKRTLTYYKQCHAFCMWHWPIGKDLDLSFIWGHHHLHIVGFVNISRPAEYLTACYIVLKRPNKVETAVHGCNLAFSLDSIVSLPRY